MLSALLFLASLFPPADPLPPVSYDDLAALPSEETVTLRLKLADEYRAALLLRAATHGNGWGLRELMDEARECRRPWELLRMARSTDPDWFEPYPLDALRELRGLLGARNFYQGCMPPAVPVWRFRRVD